MSKALEFAKYDSLFVPTDGAHGLKDSGKLLPDALRWIWRGRGE